MYNMRRLEEHGVSKLHLEVALPGVLMHCCVVYRARHCSHMCCASAKEVNASSAGRMHRCSVGSGDQLHDHRQEHFRARA